MAVHLNIHDETWNPSLASTTGKPPKSRGTPKATHGGWCAEGVSPDTLKAARGKMAADKFDAEQFANSIAAKRTRVTKPFGTHAAAVDSVAVAQAAGWLAVTIVEVKRGEPEPNPWLDGDAA